MYVIPEHFYSASFLNMKTKLLPQYSSRLQNSPFSLFGKELRSSFPKEQIPFRPPLPPPPKKRKLTCMITKKRCSVVLVDCFPFLLGEYPVFCGLSLHQGNMRSRKNPEQQFIFFYFFLPHKCKIVRFSFRYFVLVFHVNDFALLNHSINRPLCPKFLNSLS